MEAQAEYAEMMALLWGDVFGSGADEARRLERAVRKYTERPVSTHDGMARDRSHPMRLLRPLRPPAEMVPPALARAGQVLLFRGTTRYSFLQSFGAGPGPTLSGVCSASLDPRVASGFLDAPHNAVHEDPLLVTFRVPVGGGLPAPPFVGHLSSDPEQEEVLLPAGSRFRLVMKRTASRELLRRLYGIETPRRSVPVVGLEYLGE